MTDTNQLPPLPDFLSDTNSINVFVESTDEQIRDAFRAYALQAIAHATQAEATDAALIRELVDHIERNTCTHEETHRGGAIWEICDSCGARWADDEGGKPEFKWPAVVEKARAILALRPVQVPMTDEQADALATEAFGEYMCDLNDDIELALVRKVETYHHITAQAKKETP